MQAFPTLSKLGVRDRTRAVLKAFELQLVIQAQSARPSPGCARGLRVAAGLMGRPPGMPQRRARPPAPQGTASQAISIREFKPHAGLHTPVRPEGHDIRSACSAALRRAPHRARAPAGVRSPQTSRF
ncbi:hypothetical protein LUTEI9C_30209 [Luteimonas sp. 9C]|nr:hypothetical protein LUTEI9C_30209 [Luteimonas sp. 9C]